MREPSRVPSLPRTRLANMNRVKELGCHVYNRVVGPCSCLLGQAGNWPSCLILFEQLHWHALDRASNRSNCRSMLVAMTRVY
jgi:hypothetical protein